MTDGGSPEVVTRTYKSYQDTADDKRRLEHQGYVLWSGYPVGQAYRAVYVPRERLHERSLQWHFGSVFDDVLSIVNRCDPCGVLDAGAPDDEYVSEISHILVCLRDAQSELEATEIIVEEFTQAIGSPPASKQGVFEQMGKEIWLTWKRRSHS